MDGTSLFIAAIQVLLTVVCTVIPVAVIMGRMMERIKQIEKRLGGNGDSVPSRCRVNDEKIGSLKRRVLAIENSRK